jgi:ribonucleoside-diphosphate reductase alpha chain
MLETQEHAGLGLNLDENDVGVHAKTRPARTRIRRQDASEIMATPRSSGLTVSRLFTKEGRHPFDDIEWEKRQASIKNDKGETIFEDDNVEVPKTWSALATNVVASKYFYGARGTDIRERSVRQLIHRVARTITDWGLKDNYFDGAASADAFYHELAYLCVNQYAAFNSPVWFNVGLHQVYGLTSANKTSFRWNRETGRAEPNEDSYRCPQGSACFIQSVADTMEDIMRLASTEAMLFKYGSGTGTDLSTIRSSREKLSGGGTPSGPLSFMRVFDQVAAVIKSGGKTRRAAKMQSLKVDHPDIREFITAKVSEEKKARALVAAGYDGSLNGEAYSSVMFQNSNFSVRVTDEFMQAVVAGTTWTTRAVTTGQPMDRLDARGLLQSAAESAHACGDPGVQYDTTINRWHTCPNSGRINASNPCSEYMFVDNSACNLASVNLMKFVDDALNFDVARFQHAIRIMTIAQDILVDNSSYPTAEITTNSHLFRPLGLGYANLGALIMSLGLPYDSDESRALAGALTALLTGTAYGASAELAAHLAPFDEFPKNREPMLKVIRQHQDALAGITPGLCPPYLREAAAAAWARALDHGARGGFRNAQVTVLAPTGTIGFMMDCDTTGIEPDIALVKYKQLAGGGMLKLVNRSVPCALGRLGYTASQQAVILKHVEDTDSIEGCAELQEEHLPVFDCAFRARNGTRSISYRAHLKMMAAVQPFLSGAISKTVNLPTDATVPDIMQVFLDGWKMGLKAVAVYRDGSKGIQPVTTGAEKDKADAKPAAAVEVPHKPFRRRMPATRQSITHKFDVAGHQGYLTVGLYEDGAPGELFITMAKEGSTVGGTMDAFGTAISLCLQYGVPAGALIEKFSHSRFEPSGFTKNPEIPFAKSIVDYIFQWMAKTFPDGCHRDFRRPEPAPAAPSAPAPAPAAGAGVTGSRLAAAPSLKPSVATGSTSRLSDPYGHFMEDAPVCDQCGAITVRNGACYRCHVCGSSMGCS